MSTTPPTLRAIAEAAGVSKSVVHRALNGQAGVAADTARRIRRLARRMGWRPDPALAAFSRRRWPEVRTGLNIAVVHSRRHDRSAPAGPRLQQGLRQRARALGYELLRLDAHSDDLAGSLERAGVRGLVVLHNDDAGFLHELPCERYSMVSAGFTWEEAPINRVSVDIFATVRLAAERARAIAGDRVGWAIPYVTGAESDRVRIGAVLASGPWSVPLWRRPFDDPRARDRLLAWFRRHRPRVVVVLAEWMLGWLEDDGLSFPRDAGAISLGVHSQRGRISGIAFDESQVGVAAIDLLHADLLAGRSGLPEPRRVVGLGPRWCAGDTLR